MLFKLFIYIFIFLVSTLNAKLNIAVSIAPEKYFVKEIAGDYANITVMVPPGSSPHSYEPKPSQMKAISKSDIYFAIGVEFENAWLPRFVSQNPKMEVVKLYEAVKRYPMQGSKSGIDPHIWLSPENVEKMAKLIAQTLQKKDTSHSLEYKKNLDTFEKKLENLHNKIAKLIPKNINFMVFHPSWGYFAREFSIRQIPVEIEGKKPKPKELISIIQKAKKMNIKAIIVQPEFSQKSASIIANELNIPIIKISPLAEDWDKNLLKMAKAIAESR